jgi:hypothetical protein
MATTYENIRDLLDVVSETQEPWDLMLQQYSTVNMTAYGAMVTPDENLRRQINQSNVGKVKIPYMNDLADEDPVPMDDDPAHILAASSQPDFGDMYVTVKSDAKRFTQMDMILYRMQNDMNAQIRDPMAYLINNHLGPYWVRYLQRVMFSTIKGVVAANVASYSSDAVLDISAGAAADDPKYHVYICGPGTLSYAPGNLNVGSDSFAQNRPFELFREPLAGYGAGMTNAISRMRFALHPNGWSYVPAADNPSRDVLETASTWTRPWELKNAQRFVTLICNAKVGGTAGATAANCPSPQALLDAMQLLGDAQFGRFDRMVMHSAVYTYLSKLNLIQEMQYSEQNSLRAGAIYTPAGLRIIVSDEVPKFIA